ncbi:tRNA 2-thiouridine(34) synthase MnmA [bacterium]|nr:tRNA 2-thiouridine(34) synthase MnmA [bacterium]
MKILVGLSGGVDSSVTALILKQQGHDVIGATMSIWGKNGIAEKSGHKNACYGPDEKEDIEEARKIASQLNIPYYVFDCANDYEKIVLDNFKKEYLEGHTPNPCVWCNALIKFGILPTLAKQNGLIFDKFATGHYARIVEENGKFFLKRGIAQNKDQSYFLYRLKQEQLKNIIMPLGDYTKDEIRKIAKENNLYSAEKPDSQDFYGGDYNELLNVKEKEGNIVNLDGKILGKHKGIWNYTIGQRKGLGVSASEPLYVLSLRKETNEVVVGFADKTFKKSLIAEQLNWISIEKLTEEKQVKAKIRSTQQPVPATIIPYENDKVKVTFDDLQKSIAIGQSAVFYEDDTVVGGGIIQSVL